MPLLQALEKLLIEEDERERGCALDHDFIQKKTSGFHDLKQHLDQLDIDDLIKASGN
jgi:hypothetical protein